MSTYTTFDYHLHLSLPSTSTHLFLPSTSTICIYYLSLSSTCTTCIYHLHASFVSTICRCHLHIPLASAINMYHLYLPSIAAIYIYHLHLPSTCTICISHLSVPSTSTYIYHLHLPPLFPLLPLLSASPLPKGWKSCDLRAAGHTVTSALVTLLMLHEIWLIALREKIRMSPLLPLPLRGMEEGSCSVKYCLLNNERIVL